MRGDGEDREPYVLQGEEVTMDTRKRAKIVSDAAGKVQEYLAMMEDKGYKFEPIVKTSKKVGITAKETDEQFTKRVNDVLRDATRLAHVSTAYDDVYDLIHASTGDVKERWLVVEDLLGNESARIKEVLGIRTR